MASSNLHHRSLRSGVPALILGLALAACSGSPAPTLQSLAIGSGNGKAYAAVGIPQQLSLVGTYSDGTSTTLSSGVTWTTSDETVASVDDNGRLSPWRKGEGVVITARHTSTGVSATTTLSSRDVTRMTASTTPISSSVDTAETYFRASGLQPGVLYRTKVTGMTDDVDLVVYGDMSMSSSSELCVSDKVGHYAESCVAPASSAGELWIKVDGEWTNAGAQFSIEVSAAAPVTLAGTLPFPGQLPRTADIGPTTDLFKVSGLTPGAKYEVKLSQLSADIDLQVYGDLYEYALLCASYKEGTADDACIAKAGTAGELYVAVSGETTHGGGTYTLGLTLK